MEHSYDDILLLERYMEHSLNDDEVRQVEKRIAEEPGFKDLYQNEKLLVNGIRYGHLKDRMESLKEMERLLPAVSPEEKAPKTILFKTYWQPLAAAASLILLVTTFLLWNRPADPQQLFAQYYEHYPNIFRGTKRDTEALKPQDKAYIAYDNKDFAKAADGFGEMWKNKDSIAPDDRPEVLLLLGNSNLMLGKTEEARDNFITLSKDYNDLDDQAQWFLGLCYLKLNNREAAKVLFEEIAAGTNSYKEKAKELLRKLK